MDDFIQDYADNCYVCDLGDNEQDLLICDECNYRICHTYCCGLNSIPDSDWFCNLCSQQIAEKQREKQQLLEKEK